MSDAVSSTGFAIRDAKELASLFPGYDIQHLVATGGMGAVYCAVQESLDRVVAIKILPTEFSQDPEFCDGFEAEAKAMAKLNHPNLIGVFDFGEVAGMLYIIMEYVEGETLFNVTQGGIIKTSEALRLMQGICAGVASAHEHGILHRDIKPANILLDAHLQPKIGDFGLARPMDTKIQEGDQIFGTPGYTAPEVIEPPHDFNQRADIFSLGVMLHELITGKLPDEDPRPASAQVRCHPRVDAVIRKATQPDPDKRFQSAAEMAEELAKVSQPGLTKATTAIKLPTAPGAPTSALATASTTKETTAMKASDMLRDSEPKPAAGGPTLRLGAAGGALAVPQRAAVGGAGVATGGLAGGVQAGAPQQQAPMGALGGQPGALGGRPSTIMMSSGQSNNTAIWVIVIILVFAGAVILMVGGGDPPPAPEPKGKGLNDFINSQTGSGEDLLGGPDTPPAPPTPPEEPKAPEEE